jgi:hypothetical protein
MVLRQYSTCAYEAPSLVSIINYDATSKGATNYLHLAQVIKKTTNLWQKAIKKQA